MTREEVKSLAYCVYHMRLLPNTMKRYVASCLWHFLQHIEFVIGEETFIRWCINGTKNKKKEASKEKIVIRRKKEEVDVPG